MESKAQHPGVEDVDDEPWEDEDDPPEPCHGKDGVRLNQVELIGEIMKMLERRFGVQTLIHRQINSIIAGANLIVDEFAKPYREAVPGCGLSAWLCSDDVGMSSQFMAHVLAGGPGLSPYDGPAHPHDADDFSRCHRFLRCVPEARKRLPELAGKSPVWASLVQYWDELETMFEAKDYPGLSARIQDLEASVKS